MTRTALFALACVAALASEALAQADYPSRPVRIVVNSAPGGGTDILARVLAQKLSTGGPSFFVENRGGGGGIIGIEAVINAPRDGYTLLMTPSTVAVLPAVTKQARYDAAKDLAAITQVAGISNVLVLHPDVPAKSLQELVALAKAKPGTLNYGSAGAGSSPHMSMELLKYMAGIDLQHIPFKGTGPAMTEVLSGRIAALFSNLLTGKPLIEAGKLRALAVSGPKRVAAMQDVPTVAEAGVPGYSALQWYGLLAPAGTPQLIVDKLAGRRRGGVAPTRCARAARPRRRRAGRQYVRGVRRPDQVATCEKWSTSPRPLTSRLNSRGARCFDNSLVRFALLLVASAAQAQSYCPTKPVKILVPTAPGGTADATHASSRCTSARSWASNSTSRTAAARATSLGIDSVVRSPADGYTLLVGAGTITLNHLVYKNLPYDVLRDLTPVTQMVSVPNVLVVHPSLPMKTLADYIAAAKAKPGQINYGSAGVGSISTWRWSCSRSAPTSSSCTCPTRASDLRCRTRWPATSCQWSRTSPRPSRTSTRANSARSASPR